MEGRLPSIDLRYQRFSLEYLSSGGGGVESEVAMLIALLRII